MNKVILVGNLGKDAQVINIKEDEILVKLLIATKDHPNQEKADWHEVVVKNTLARTCVNLKKGQKVAVEGRAKTHSWIDKGTQETRYVKEVLADQVEFLTYPKEVVE